MLLSPPGRVNTTRESTPSPVHIPCLQQPLFRHLSVLIAAGDVGEDSPFVSCLLQEIRDLKLDDAVAGLLESRSPDNGGQCMEWAQRHVANRDCLESAHAVLAIDVGDLPEPLDEA